MQIELTRGLFAEIDDEDFESVKGINWMALSSSAGHFYAAASTQTEGGKPKYLLMHRLLIGAKEDMLVDHRDGNGLNNRRANLRECTVSQNAMNGRSKLGASGVRGVWLEKAAGRKKAWWVGAIWCRNKRHRKNFDSKEAAARWVEVQRARLHAEFAYSPKQDARIGV